MIRLYFIGIAMGIADLIPGVSGGTIAFITGIYEGLLASIKTLQLHSLKKIAWSFLLPLGAGILSALIFASRFFYYMLVHHPTPLFAFFFGVILASIFFCGRKAHLHRASHWGVLLLGALTAFFITGLSLGHPVGIGFIGLCIAGLMAAGAMLLPGISGSYLLHLLGIYSTVLAALNAPMAPGSLKVLIAIGLGISLGCVMFSRVVSWLMQYLSTWTQAILIGFMVGSTRAIWPFHQGGWGVALFCTLIGFFLVFFLELSVKRTRSSRRMYN